jgi:hypothetical protein
MPDATSGLIAQVYMPGNVNVDFDGASLGAPQVADAVYKPVAITDPTVTGTAKVGSIVTCTGGSWDSAPDEPTSYAYSWFLGGTPVQGANGPSFSITAVDTGQNLSCSIAASNAAGSAVAASRAVGPIAGTPTTAPGSPSTITPTDTTQAPQECVVPRLHGVTLASARRLLTLAHCRLGKVRQSERRGQSTRRPERVTHQSARDGSKHSHGYRIGVTVS